MVISVIGSGAQTQPDPRHFPQGMTVVTQCADRSDLLGGHVGVTEDVFGLGKALVLHPSGLLHPLPKKRFLPPKLPGNTELFTRITPTISYT